MNIVQYFRHNMHNMPKILCKHKDKAYQFTVYSLSDVTTTNWIIKFRCEIFTDGKHLKEKNLIYGGLIWLYFNLML